MTKFDIPKLSIRNQCGFDTIDVCPSIIMGYMEQLAEDHGYERISDLFSPVVWGRIEVFKEGSIQYCVSCPKALPALFYDDWSLTVRLYSGDSKEEYLFEGGSLVVVLGIGEYVANVLSHRFGRPKGYDYNRNELEDRILNDDKSFWMECCTKELNWKREALGGGEELWLRYYEREIGQQLAKSDYAVVSHASNDLYADPSDPNWLIGRYNADTPVHFEIQGLTFLDAIRGWNKLPSIDGLAPGLYRYDGFSVLETLTDNTALIPTRRELPDYIHEPLSRNA
ncbi:hypothetical protein ACQU0X_25625 [Pseudovibrio ascidiaceicola]|uniref:hypothetical protein n=1 Tax=Pseudovibrio ascidiaceicola TaxID=285279 RepID=UPI003D360612